MDRRTIRFRDKGVIMNSEKVKEIKECLEEFKDDRIGYYTNGIDRFVLTKEDILALINELETENERLKHLNNSISLGADLHAESYQQEITELDKENQQLKDRIAELENTDYYNVNHCTNLEDLERCVRENKIYNMND